MKVKNKKVIITGAGGGLGRELSLGMLALGAEVMAIDINEENLKKLKKDANNEHLYIYPLNITDDGALEKFKVDYIKEHKSLDILINNAGIIQPFVSVSELEMDTINRVMNINFFGALKLIKLFLNELGKRKEAAIVNVSSMGGFFPFPGQSVYGASKAALKLFTEGLYAELLGTGIHVAIVFPGAINTDIAKNSNVEIKEAKESGSYKMLSPAKAARIIIKGILKNKFQIYVGTDSKIMHLLYTINSKAAIKFIKQKMQ